VRRDTLFQIGSISKVYLATLAMRLVEEGKLTLDTPVASVLPELELADREAQQAITLWHLLTHTSGIEGDRFDDYGYGDDALARYVAGSGKRPADPSAGPALELLQQWFLARRAG
jgi:CubicO group peptidase (beta-lactamase class C family)